MGFVPIEELKVDRAENAENAPQFVYTDAGSKTATVFYTALKMPLYDAGTLSSRVKPCTLPFLLRVGQSVRKSLESAHESNQVHLDVKPDNIFMQSNGQVFIGDFGVSCVIGESPRGISPQYYPNDLPVVTHPAADFILLAVSLLEMRGVEFPPAEQFRFEDLKSQVER
jgi:serine/threonine protein kinase